MEKLLDIFLRLEYSQDRYEIKDFMSSRHYETGAQWLRELGLLTAGSLVIQKIVTGASLTDPVVVTGIIVAGTLYVLAARFLLKS